MNYISLNWSSLQRNKQSNIPALYTSLKQLINNKNYKLWKIMNIINYKIILNWENWHKNINRMHRRIKSLSLSNAFNIRNESNYLISKIKPALPYYRIVLPIKYLQNCIYILTKRFCQWKVTNYGFRLLHYVDFALKYVIHFNKQRK